MPNQKSKKKNGNAFLTVILVACCVGMGFLIGSLGVLDVSEDVGFFAFMANYLLQILLLFLSFYLQVIIHEGGHLIAGLVTGYRFSSFRIGSLMLLKNHEGYSLKRFSLTGTGGQCLLIPPDKGPNGTYPYKLYHLGGILINLITAALFFALFCLCRAENAARTFLLYLACSGALCAVTNGIPVRMGGIATDGYNVIHIGKEPFALDAMWLQLKINEAQTEGIRLKDLPEEWFRIPENAAKSNEIIAAIEIFSENRAMDALDFLKAKEIITTLESGEYSIIGLYQNLLLFDKITIDLIENRMNADISELNSRQIKAFRKAMAKYPAVIRTEYAIRLLKDKNLAAAEKYRDYFNTVALKYPMRSDIESETEIMDYLNFCANNDNLQQHGTENTVLT